MWLNGKVVLSSDSQQCQVALNENSGRRLTLGMKTNRLKFDSMNKKCYCKEVQEDKGHEKNQEG